MIDPTDELKAGSKYSEFRKYHTENPEIFRLFCHYAMNAIERERTYFGAMMIIQRIRWYSMVEAKGDDFKINNNYSPYYARLFEIKYPQFRGFFAKRRLN